MRLSFLAVSAIALVAAAAPASAAVIGLSGVSLSSPFVFTPVAGSTFTFAFNSAAAAQFDPSPYSVQTTGTAQTTVVFGQPSGFFTRSNILVDGNIFPGFGSVPTLSAIGSSLTPTDLGLRYAVGSDFFYGYARLNGNGTLDIAFNDVANVGINAGAAITGTPAVPEPATWAMMIGGFGLIGSAMRRRRTTVSFA